MKKIYQVLLSSSLVFSVSTIAKAQPPEPTEPAIQLPPLHYSRTSEDTVQRFISESAMGNATYPNDYVEGVDNSNAALPQIGGIRKLDLGNFVLAARDITISPNPQSPDLVTANFTLEFSDDALGLKLAQKDSVELKRHLIPNNKQEGKNEYWSIVPGDPQKYFEDNSSPEKSGFTERLATLFAYSKEMLPKIHLQQSELQLKQLGLALMMFSQDYAEQLVFTQENYVEKLTPYLKNKTIFVAPGTNADATNFTINPNIAGLKLTQDLDYEDTVAFYLGKDQKLDFRYDGLSPVCFLDGHVEAISPEEAKNLEWQP